MEDIPDTIIQQKGKGGKIVDQECSTFPTDIDFSSLIRKHNRRSEGSGREDGSVEDSNDDKVGLLTSALMEEELEENMSV